MITFLLGTCALCVVFTSFPLHKGAKHEYYPTHGAGLLLQSLKTVESPETYKGDDSAVAAVTVMIALVHFFYVGYFFWQLLVACMSQWPDVFVKLYAAAAPHSLRVRLALHLAGQLTDTDAFAFGECRRLGRRFVQRVAASSSVKAPKNNGDEGVVMTALDRHGSSLSADRSTTKGRPTTLTKTEDDVMRDAFLHKHRQVL